MDVKFDSAAAKELIVETDAYCKDIVHEAKELQGLFKDNREWNDRQYKAFQNNMQMIFTDLNQVLKYEGDYLKTFQARVKELR